MTFGEKLSSLRKQSNLTQKDLAEKLNVSRQAITKWENDAGLPDINNLKKISSLFAVTIDELLDYKVEEINIEFKTAEENESEIKKEIKTELETKDINYETEIQKNATTTNIIKEEIIDKNNSKLKNVFNYVLDKFSDADIVIQLSRTLKLTFWQEVLDFFVGSGTLEVADIVKTGFVYPFLIIKGDEEFLVLVSKGKLLTKKLNEKFTEKKKVIDGYKYTKIKTLKTK